MRKYKPDESGQALLMGLFLLIAGWLAALGCIRLARMLAEEVRVTNANDAVAYSTGIFHARLLNHDAYLNRALINNELAITQWTQLSSRIKTAKTNKLQKLYQYSENAIQEHKRINLTLKAKQDNAHHNIASTRQRLQKDIVVANLSELSGQVNYAQGWRKVGGWHTGGVFQGIDENDARNKTEEERENGAKNETPFTVSNKDESTALVKQEAQKIPYLKKAKEYINSIIPLRTLSTTAANTLLPQHRYRVRTRYSYSSDNTPFDQQNLLTAATTITTSAPSPALDFPYKDFRTDIEIKFIDPENQKEQQGDLLHPYWRPH